MKRKRIWLCIIFIILIFTLFSTPIYGKESDAEDVTLSPYFFIKDGDTSVDKFPLKETNVSTNINGVIAETYVTQSYANEGENPINASYVFPASTKVTVHGMKMEIGDQVVTAKIKEKEEAKQEFEQAQSEGKSASLLEEQRPNVFTMDVANIMPGDVVKIELHYTELVTSTEGTYQFVFPTVVGPRYASPSENGDAVSDQWVESPYLKSDDTASEKYNITVNLSTGVPITNISSKSHKINLEQGKESTAQITLANPEEFAGNRDFILEYKLTGNEVSSGLLLGTGKTENFFMLMVQPPERYTSEDIPPREYIFVLDISGSMEGEPIETAKELIRNLVTNLEKTDTFNMVLFSDETTQMSPKSVLATEENVKNAITLIDNQIGGGGTEMAPALKNAIAIPKDENFSRSIVVITDGYLSGEAEIFDLVNNNLGTTNFFSFGIGSSVNHYLIDGIAKAGMGEAFVVTDFADTKVTSERFRAYIQAPILTDIQVKYNNFDTYDIEPANLPTLFAERPIVLFGKWRGEPTGTIEITGKKGTENYVQEIQVTEAEPLETNNAIGYLWARTKVDALTGYGADYDLDDVKQEITKLGLDYSMMTPYTSFIAVIDTVRNTDGKSTDVKQPLPLPLNVSDLSVGGGYTSGSEPGDIILISLMVLLLFITILRRTRRKNMQSL